MKLITNISPAQQKELFKNLYYLNMQELKTFCNRYQIPYAIYYRKNTGVIIKTNQLDRKAIILDRIKYLLQTEKIKKLTLFPDEVVNLNKLSNKLTANDAIFYGQYKNGDKKILALLKDLTEGQFAFGAIAQEVLRDCWVKGVAPTYKQFAELWLQAKAAHKKPNPEWAYLTDLEQGIADKNWKQLRIKKAQMALQVLNKIKLADLQKDGK